MNFDARQSITQWVIACKWVANFRTSLLVGGIIGLNTYTCGRGDVRTIMRVTRGLLSVICNGCLSRHRRSRSVSLALLVTPEALSINKLYMIFVDGALYATVGGPFHQICHGIVSDSNIMV